MKLDDYNNRIWVTGCTDTSDLRHFRPKTFRRCVFGAEVSHIFALVPLDTSAPVPKCLGQFGTKVHETLRTQNKNRPMRRVC